MDFLHPPLARLLFLQQLAFSSNVTAVAFGCDVFSERLDRRSGNDLTANGGLDGYLEHLPGYQLTHTFDEFPAPCIRLLAVYDER